MENRLGVGKSFKQNTPRVSICIPCRNTRPFLEERRETIEKQSFTDFEVIIVDDGSNDGSREFFEEWAASDERVLLYAGPEKGLYPGWNDAISRAKGDFIYIATSDDTMASNCLEELVNALEENPNCGIAHCKLRAFADEDPREVENSWWATSSPFARSVGGMVDKAHVRHAPGDGIYHACGASLFVSVTQLLIRRSVYDQIGYYSDKWGSLGDFEWAARAGFSVNTIHVPTTWGGWRMHSNQATAQASMTALEQLRRNRLVFDDVLSNQLISPAIADIAMKLRDCQNYLDERQEIRRLMGCSFTKKMKGLLNFEKRRTRVLADAALAQMGFNSRWRFEDAELFADCIQNSMKWIDFD